MPRSPVESVIKAVKLAIRLTLLPNVELQKIGKDSPDQARILVRFVLPLACIPALSWCLGFLLSGDARPFDWGEIMHRGAVVYVGSLLSIYLLSISLFMLAPLFSVRRDWGRAFQVAAYSTAPVMLAGLLLVLPILAFVTLLAICHSFYLQYVGVNCILGAKEGESAEYVALVAVLLVVSSTFVGALGSCSGVL